MLVSFNPAISTFKSKTNTKAKDPAFGTNAHVADVLAELRLYKDSQYPDAVKRIQKLINDGVDNTGKALKKGDFMLLELKKSEYSGTSRAS